MTVDIASSPIEIAFPAPKSLIPTKVNLHLTLQTTCFIFLTTTAQDDYSPQLRPMGSFVLALPDLTDVPGKSALCTPLFNVPSSADFATRMAKILARKMRRPVYVGCSVETSGLTGEEEMELFKRTIEVIMQQFRTSREKVEEQKAQE